MAKQSAVSNAWYSKGFAKKSGALFSKGMAK